MRIVLFGPPGAGKGTQANLLSSYLKVPHLSTGEILRSKLNDKDELSMKLKNTMSSGNLVSDNILNSIVSDKLLSDECKIIDKNDIQGKINQITLTEKDEVESNGFFITVGGVCNILKSENSFIQYEDNEGSIILPEPNILGDHQLSNISTSIATSRKLFNIKDKDIKNAIIKIDLKGRLQEIKSGKLKKLVGLNRLVCDGEHNTNSAIAIAKWVKQQNQGVHLIIGMMQDKDHQGFIKCFKENIKSITLVDIPNQENSIKKEDLKKKINGINKKINLGNSIEESIKAMNKYENNVCLIIGSLYLIGEVLNLN